MPRFTLADVNAFELRQHPLLQRGGAGVSRESDLHDQISDYCRAHGLIALHSRMDTAATLTVGAPDFVLLCENGRTLYVECKRKDGKLSKEQMALHAWARRLGHVIHVVRSMADFMEVIK